MGWLCAFALASMLDSSVPAGKVEDAPPEAWRELATNSHVVAVATVIVPRILVVWPDRKRWRVVLASDGRPTYVSPGMISDYPGVVVRIQIEQLFKTDAHADVGSEEEVFLPWLGPEGLAAGERLLVFLRNPLYIDAQGVERYDAWSLLEGTVLKYPDDLGREREEFKFWSAYGLAETEICRGEKALLRYGTDPEKAIDLAIRMATEQAQRPEP